MPYSDPQRKNAQSRRWYAANKEVIKKKLQTIHRDLPIEKRCAKCQAVKPASEFGLQLRHTSGLQSYCKQCVRDLSNVARLRNPDKHRRDNTLWARRNRLGKKYGITQEILDDLLAKQQGVCAVCGEAPKGVRTRSDDAWLCLYIDHDHATGQVRGLLCRQCNVLLGWLEKNAERVTGLQHYLANPIVIG